MWRCRPSRTVRAPTRPFSPTFRPRRYRPAPGTGCTWTVTASHWPARTCSSAAAAHPCRSSITTTATGRPTGEPASQYRPWRRHRRRRCGTRPAAVCRPAPDRFADTKTRGPSQATGLFSLRKACRRGGLRAQQHPVHPLHEGGRVGQLGAGGDLGLLQQQVGEVLRLAFVGFGFHALEQRMARVDLQHGLALGQFLASFAQQAREVRRHLVIAERKAGRRVGEAGGNLDLAHALAEQVLEFLQQGLGLLRDFLLLLLLRLVQRQFALGHVPELLALVLAEVTHHPLVDAVEHQQHLYALGAERLQLRAAGGGDVVVGGDVPDRLLAHRHAADVVVQRDVLPRTLTLGAGEAQQFGDALTVRGVLADAFLQRVAESLEERCELLRLVLRQLLDQVQHALHASRLDAIELAVVLQDLAADVERQVVGVDHAAHETQV